MSKEIAFYSVRHGETEWNREKRIQGYTDVPLSAQGLANVHLFGAELAERREELGIEVIFSSDLMRASITADTIAQYLQVPVIQDLRLRERNYGAFEGRTFEELEEEFGTDRIEAYHPEGGESLGEFDMRIGSAVKDILRARSGQGILFVSHGGVIRSKVRQFGEKSGLEGIGYDIKNLSIHRFVVPFL